MPEQASIGVSGLATMGRNIARNLARAGYPVAVHNRSESKTRELMAHFSGEGEFLPGYNQRELVRLLARPRTIIVMVQAGKPTDAVIEQFAELLEAGDVLVDAGNADFTDTRRREQQLRDKGLHFVGTGVSGGEEGALHGPSIMPGGSAEAYATLGPILERISAHVRGAPCCTHVGPDGAGHFVKMVHNGIEYAVMQFIAEAHDLLRAATGRTPTEIAEVFAGWNAGRLSSYLVEITAQVAGHTDPATGEAFVDVVADEAEQKGTGRATVHSALERGTPAPGIAEAVFARSLSGHTELRRAGQGLPGPSAPAAGPREEVTRAVEEALYAATLVAYAQGFNLIADGSEHYGWGVDLGAVARIWRGGCIIRAGLLDEIAGAYDAEPPATLLTHQPFADAIGAAQDGWRQVIGTAARLGVPAPGLSSALAYYDTLRARRLPTALLQGLRDFFGAHTYRRVDADGTFHTNWATDRSEQRV
jgi:6-phosphogluconate dehydrogenase